MSVLSQNGPGDRPWPNSGSDWQPWRCLLYTSDAADERSSVDLGGRRIIKKKKNTVNEEHEHVHNKTTDQRMS